MIPADSLALQIYNSYVLVQLILYSSALMPEQDLNSVHELKQQQQQLSHDI